MLIFFEDEIVLLSTVTNPEKIIFSVVMLVSLLDYIIKMYQSLTQIIIH